MRPGAHEGKPSMAYEIPGFKFTLPAASTLATDIAADNDLRFRFLSVNSSGTVDFTAAGDHDSDALAYVGVLQDDPQVTNAPAEIMHSGVSKVEAGTGGVTRGQRVVAVDGTTSAGRAVDVTAQGDNQIALGIALETAAVGELFACLLIPGGDRTALS